MEPIALTSRANIALASEMSGLSADEISKMTISAAKKKQKSDEKQWAIEFFDKDEEWYESTLKKVEEISLTLDSDINRKEKCIKLYGWIAYEIPQKKFSIPMEMNREYATAQSIKLILTDLSCYHKIINWD